MARPTSPPSETTASSSGKSFPFAPTALRWLTQIGASPLAERLGLRAPLERLVHIGARDGMRAATAVAAKVAQRKTTNGVAKHEATRLCA